LYSPQQLQELASILAMKNLGISLAQVQELTAKRGDTIARRATLNELKRTIEQSIHAATRSLNWINTALEEFGEKAPIPVIVKRRPAIPIASFRVTVNSYAEVSRFEEELTSALPAQCLGTLRGVLWHRCADSGSLEAEPFIALKRRIPSPASYDLKYLPEATLACAYSGLEDESAEQAYAAIRRWMNVRGYRLAGPKRELNLGQILEVQFPLAEN